MIKFQLKNKQKYPFSLLLRQKIRGYRCESGMYNVTHIMYLQGVLGKKCMIDGFLEPFSEIKSQIWVA